MSALVAFRERLREAIVGFMQVRGQATLALMLDYYCYLVCTYSSAER